MSAPQPSSHDSKPAQGSKRKRSTQPNTVNPTPSTSSTSFISPNPFAVLSDSESELEEPNHLHQSTDRRSKIPPIVIYSLLNNHSATLQQVNTKLTCPVEVKTKPNRLLLCTKSTQDYNPVLSEIQTAKLEYHTYPPPDATQTRLVLKGIPPNVPEEDIREALMTNDKHTEKIYQITKTDKTTREVLSTPSL